MRCFRRSFVVEHAQCANAKDSTIATSISGRNDLKPKPPFEPIIRRSQFEIDCVTDG
jgi:hypothetical protein